MQIGMPTIKNVNLRWYIGEQGKNCAKVVKPLVDLKKNNKPKKETCGINPSSGRCKIGMPKDKKCKIGVTKNGGKNCAKVVKDLLVDLKTKPVDRPKKVGRPEKQQI